MPIIQTTCNSAMAGGDLLVAVYDDRDDALGDANLDPRSMPQEWVDAVSKGQSGAHVTFGVVTRKERLARLGIAI